MFIYTITNITNNKKYIGKTTYKNPRYRWHNHLSTLRYGNHKNSYLQNAWNRSGEVSFSFDVIAKCQSLEELDKTEERFIHEYKTNNPQYGYNLSVGGEGAPLTEECKKKIGNAHRGKPKTELHKKRISEANTGKIRTQEQRERISIARRGKKVGPPSEETRRKISESNIGKHSIPHSEETKRKIGKAHTGTGNGFYGKKHSIESKKKITEANIRRWNKWKEKNSLFGQNDTAQQP